MTALTFDRLRSACSECQQERPTGIGVCACGCILVLCAVPACRFEEYKHGLCMGHGWPADGFAR